MKACVRHWKVYYGGFWHHFLDFRRLPIARLHWKYNCIVEMVNEPGVGVRRTSWQSVLEGVDGARPVLVREVAINAEAVFERTRRELRQQRYNLLFNNCEHFANRCMLGVRRSRQVRLRTVQAATSFSFGLTGLGLIHADDSVTTPFLIGALSIGVSVFFGTLFADFVIRSLTSLHRLRRRRAARKLESTGQLLSV
jgi:hypothetical protein